VDDQFWVGLLMVLLLIPVAVIIVGVSVVAHLRFKASSRLDGLWDWIGKGTRSLGSGRVWSGTVDGRHVRVDFFEDSTEVHVQARPKVRIGFGREDEPQSVIPEAREGLHVFTLDGGEVGYADQPSTVPALVRQPGVEEALRTLLANDGASLRSIDVDPQSGVGWFARNLPEGSFGREDAERWVRALLAVATASESVPA
jgi:hypothetical protein